MGVVIAVGLIAISVAISLESFRAPPNRTNPTRQVIAAVNELEAANQEYDEMKKAFDKEPNSHIWKSRLKEAEKRLRNAEKAEAKARAMKRTIKPTLWPTEADEENAKFELKMQDDLLHFAIAGPSGTGKSSLINAFRGLQKGDTDYAPVGVVETTSEIGRYPDPNEERKRMVWYDIPGAGTPDFPKKDYFIKMRLFVFDFIILTVGDRFTEIDTYIIEECDRFAIPIFLVRSKADQNIRNLESDNPDWDLKQCRENFISTTLKDMEKKLASIELKDKKVYIVSSPVMKAITSKTIVKESSGSSKKVTCEQIIDEADLIKKVVETIRDRRYWS